MINVKRWQTGQEVSPKSQDAGIENVRVMKQATLGKLMGFLIVTDKLQ